jgi:hypothetical protein
MIDHDIAYGPIKRCQVCGFHTLEPVIDLGHQPLCDSLLSREQLDRPEPTFPLRLVRCPKCGLGQLDYAVDNSVVYHPEYPYRSGITPQVVEHMQGLAQYVAKLGIREKSFAVDIGSNDGTLLWAIKRHGAQVLGVEPTNIALIARELGVATIQSFFSEKLAIEIAKEHGQADLLTATNVFAHMTSLGQVMRGAEILLSNGGIFVVEVHYLLEILRKGQYDSIYHEHLRSYSLKSLCVLFDMYDFTVVDAEVMDRYSGTIRLTARKGKGHTAHTRIGDLLKVEEEFGIFRPEVHAAFVQKALRARRDLMALALECWGKGLDFVGNSCPGRCSTLINYTGLDTTLMPYICEQPTSLKLGMYLPGKHIPIVGNTRLIEDQPDFVVLLAWHYADPIIKELRDRGVRSKLVIPLPELRIVTN